MTSPQKPKTILVIVRHPVGGIRTFLRYFHRSMDRDAYRFIVLTAGSVELAALRADLEQPNVRIVGLAPGASAVAMMKAMAKILRSEEIALVHAHGLGSGLTTAWLGRLARVPVLLTLHDVFVPKQFQGLRGLAKRLVIGLGLLVPSKIHCVSHDAARNLMTYFPVLGLVKRSPVAVVLNGIISDQFTRSDRRNLVAELALVPQSLLVGFLGRFMNQKGFAELVGAVEILRADASLPRPFHVLCFSPEDGFIREERADVTRRGLDGIIRFLPFVADVGPTLRGLSVVAIPSRWEACPLLPMEVMTAGIPLIASDCIGLREVVLDTPARIFPTGSSAALAEAIKAEMREPSTEAAAAFAPTAATRFDVSLRTLELLAIVKHTAR